MSIKKKSLHSAVASSFVRRPPYDGVDDEVIDDFTSLAPYDEPIKSKLRAKPVRVEPIQGDEYDFQMLSRTELRILTEIACRINNETNMSPPIYLCDISEKLGCPISTIKKLIQYLEKKSLLKRVKFKAGRGGWTIYSMTIKVINKLEIN